MSVVVNNASLASGVTIATYAPPSGFTALLLSYSVFLTSGAADTAVVVLRLTTAASVVIDIESIAAAAMDTDTGHLITNIALNDGDSISLVVTTTDDTETADLTLNAKEYFAT